MGSNFPNRFKYTKSVFCKKAIIYKVRHLEQAFNFCHYFYESDLWIIFAKDV
jgi:hypothetical protein